MQSLIRSNRIMLTKEQIQDAQKFNENLQNGSVKIAFEGSLLEGHAYLKGLAEIVEATRNS